MLNRLQGPENLVVYTIDERQAESVAIAIANDPTASAILVADECSLATQMRLAAILSAHRRRARVVAIDNTSEQFGAHPAGIWLRRIPDETVGLILECNYFAVPPDRRRAYVELSGGFVRLAADLCRRDDIIAPAGQIDPALTDISEVLPNVKTEFGPL